MRNTDISRIVNLIRAGHRQEIQHLLDTVGDNQRICWRCRGMYDVSEFRNISMCRQCKKEYDKQNRGLYGGYHS